MGTSIFPVTLASNAGEKHQLQRVAGHAQRVAKRPKVAAKPPTPDAQPGAAKARGSVAHWIAAGLGF